MVPSFIDTHTHIYAEDFDIDRDTVVSQAVKAGAERLLLPNIDAHSIRPMMALCDKYPQLCLPMMGLHPTELPDDPEPLLNQMYQMLAASHNSTKAPHKFVAVGEVGIDLYWDQSRRDEQIAVFKQQIEWSCEFKLPLVIHSRNAHRDLMDTLTPYKSRLCGGIFHCFGGNQDEVTEMLAFDRFMIGVGGAVTYAFGKHFPPKDPDNLHPKVVTTLQNQETLPGVLRAAVPLERVVVETDAPYLSPAPRRGQRNVPANIPYILQALTLIYNRSYQDVAQITTRNAKCVFGL